MSNLKFFIIALIFLVVGYLGYNYYSKGTAETRDEPVGPEITAPAKVLEPTPEAEIQPKSEPAKVGQIEDTKAGETTMPASIGVYFLDEKAFAAGQEPYEKLALREFDPEQIDEVEVLTHIFRGPTPEERQAGLVTVLSGAKGFELRISKGIARVYLKGGCTSGGSTYTIANLIFKNLSQFPDIKAVKIYDPQGQTAKPEGEGNSMSACLEP